MADVDALYALIARLAEASATLSAARDVVADVHGLDDPMFDQLVEAGRVTDAAAERIQELVDTYGEMVHFGA